jgi:hypothetical protein
MYDDFADSLNPFKRVETFQASLGLEIYVGSAVLVAYAADKLPYGERLMRLAWDGLRQPIVEKEPLSAWSKFR